MGRLAEEADASGAVTRYGYDLLGRRTIVSPPHPEGRSPVEQQRDDAEAQLVGSWQVAAGGWQGTHRYAAAASGATPSATWTFSQLRPGATYEVLATWDPRPENATRATVHVQAEGTCLTEPIVVDQSSMRGDVVREERAWQRLATVAVATTTLEVRWEASATPGRLVADGVWLVEVSGTAYTVHDTQGNVLAESDGAGQDDTVYLRRRRAPHQHERRQR